MGGGCVDGLCQPVVLAENEGLAPPAYGPRALVVDDSHVFWTTADAIHRVPVGGGRVEDLGWSPADDPGWFALDPGVLRLDGGWLYLGRGAEAILRVPKDGGASEIVTPVKPDVEGTIQSFEVQNGVIAWLGQILRADGVWWPMLRVCDALPCVTARDPYDGEQFPLPFAIGKSATHLYVSYDWPIESGQVAMGIKCLGGAYKSALVTNSFAEVVVEEQLDQAYAYGCSFGFVGRARLPRTRPPGNPSYVPDKVLASDETMYAHDLVLDGDDLYWLADAIYRVPKDGSALPERFPGWNVTHLAVGKDAFYLTTHDGKIAKVAKPLPRAMAPKLP